MTPVRCSSAQTTASEFGGINCTYTRLHGATSNPYDLERTPGGSSGGSAASVSGGLLPLCTGGDGGGSIRIPAGFTGLFGLKATFGRIPKGPHTEIEPLTAVMGCLSRSVRDVARWFDACNGADEYDPFSLPRVEGWEAGLGQQDIRGKRVAVSVDLGAAIVASAVRDKVDEAADLLIKDAGLERVDVPIALPRGGLEWALAGTASLLVGLGDLYPACESELTPEIMLAANIATNHFNLDTAKNIEAFRRQIIVQMAEIFEQVDFIICATNPDVAFAAQGPMPTTIDGVDLISEYGFEAAVGQQRRTDDPGQYDRAPGGRHPDRPGRRPPGVDADHRAATRRATAPRPGSSGRARASVAARRAGSADLSRALTLAAGGHFARVRHVRSASQKTTLGQLLAMVGRVRPFLTRYSRMLGGRFSCDQGARATEATWGAEHQGDSVVTTRLALSFVVPLCLRVTFGTSRKQRCALACSEKWRKKCSSPSLGPSRCQRR